LDLEFSQHNFFDRLKFTRYTHNLTKKKLLSTVIQRWRTLKVRRAAHKVNPSEQLA